MMDTGRVANLLVRVPNWIGDAVMCTPALMDLRLSFPQAQITILARPSIVELLRAHPGVDDALVYEHRGRHRTVSGKLALAAELKKRAFEVAILFQNAFEAACLSACARIPERWGYATDGRSWLLTRAIPIPLSRLRRHQVDYYRGLLDDLGLPTRTDGPRLVVTPEEDRALNVRLSTLGLEEEARIICLNPGSVYGTAKRWMPERFAAVADQLIEDGQAWSGSEDRMHCVIVGGNGEEALGERIAERMRHRPLVLSGKTNVRELMCVIKRSLLFLTNDTGPMHIADAFGIPTVAVFGPTDPRTTAPYHAAHALVRHPVSCAPCLLRHCPIDHRCMTRISVDDVLRAARSSLRESFVPAVRIGEG